MYRAVRLRRYGAKRATLFATSVGGKYNGTEYGTEPDEDITMLRATSSRSFRQGATRLRLEQLEQRALMSVTPGPTWVPITPSGGLQIAMDLSGRFAVADRERGAIFYDAEGNEVGSNSSQCAGAIVASPQGGFISSCEGWGQSGIEVYGQRFDTVGNSVGPQFQLNNNVYTHQQRPRIGVQPSGDFIATWTSWSGGLEIRRFEANGLPIADEANALPGERQDDSLIGVARNGDFAIASRELPKIQFYTSDGAPKGAPVIVGGGDINGFDLLPDGRAIVAITNDATGRFIRIVSEDGTIQRINAPQSLDVAPLANGGFLAAYIESNNIFVQEYSPDAAPVGDRTLVGVSASAYKVSLATDGSDHALVTWKQGTGGGNASVRLLDLDIASPTIYPTRLTVPGDEAGIREGARLVSQVTELNLEFSRGLWDAPADEPASPANPANWRLTRNGVDVSSLLAYITVTPIADLSDAATLAFTEPLPDGDYVLTALGTMLSESQIAIDGDLDGLPGGNFSTAFSALTPAPVGGEFRLNTVTAGDQRTSPASLQNVAVHSDGSFVATWASYGQDGSGWGVYARRFDGQGEPLGPEFLVNTYTTGDQRFSTIAMDDEGDFVITWTSDGQDGSGYGVYARCFAASGEVQSDELRVNDVTAGSQGKSVVAMDSDGDFMIVWEAKDQDGFGYGIYSARYDASANNRHYTDELVNQTVLSDQRLAGISMNASGDFVVTWTSFNQDGSGDGVYARHIYALGEAGRSDEFRVNTTTASTQRFARVAMDETGDFTVVWMSNLQDGDGYGVYAQRFNAAGAPVGDEFRVNQTAAGTQQYPVIGMDDDGDTVIAWASGGQDSDDFGIYARRYSSNGVVQGDEFRVNSTTAGQQNLPSVSVDSDGDFTIVWSSEDQDGDGFGVYGQRYSANGTPTADAGGPYAVQEGNALALNATGSFDPDASDVLTFTWDVNGDGVFGDANGATPNLSWAQLVALGVNDGPATWSEVRLRVTDSSGNSDEDVVALQITDRAPVIAVGGAAMVNEGAVFTLNLGAITDPGMDTVSQWIVRWGDGTTNVYASKGAKTHVYANGAATNTIFVDLVDEDGTHLSAATKQVTVNNVAPELSGVTAATIFENGTAMLRGTITDPGSTDAFTLQVFWGDGSAPQTIQLPAGITSFEIPHQYLDDPSGPPPDEYPIDVILRDSDNAQDTGSIRVVVNNVAPTASIVGQENENPVGEPVALTAGIADPGTLDTFTYSWTVERNGQLFASGATSNIEFTPDTEADYVVYLTVTDDDGGVGTRSTTVRVPGGDVIPVAGDTNGDGVVDLIDLNNVRNNFGGTGTGDTNDDGIVDLVDLNAVRNNFGASGSPAIELAGRTVPSRQAEAVDALFATWTQPRTDAMAPRKTRWLSR